MLKEIISSEEEVVREELFDENLASPVIDNHANMSFNRIHLSVIRSNILRKSIS